MPWGSREQYERELGAFWAEIASALVSLDQVLRRVIDETAEFAESHGVVLARSSETLGLAQGDEELFVRALSALLKTAVKFSNEGETVQLKHESSRDKIGRAHV